VPLEIDPMIVDLVGRFAVKIKNPGWKRVESNNGRKHWLDQWSADYNLVNADLAEAHYLLGRPFWLTYNSDRRGRVFSLQHLNYGREDHVRAMFRFHNGMKLSSDGLFWLAVQVANCEGSTDKLTWNERVAWVGQNYSRIERIGTVKDPGVVFNEWRDADKPFAFVAACREYVAAKADPENFVTHLPVGFDHTCSGIQHLSMICRDKSAAALVNLLDADRPQDVYMAVALKIKQLVNAAEGEFADWWKAIFTKLSDRDIRKLFKRPVMTFGYAAGNSSRQQQISKEYYKLFKDKASARFMRWMKDLAEYHASRGSVLTWTSPTGFQVRNAYHVKKENIVSLQRGGIRIRFKLADGATHQIVVPKAIRSAPANFVHSMDASHLVRVVNAAIDPHEGINDILVVHDSFAAHAPNAVRLNQLIRRELGMMYQAYEPVAHLCANNPCDRKPPPLGDYDPLDVLKSEWACI
jgi:DNA-directed RNA polymerase